jgi:cytoskeletal protein RodZ
MAFVIRQFHHTHSLGDKLLALRKEAKLTLSEISAKTKIQKSFLKAFEAGDYHKLPDPIYSRNFLKRYVKTLGGDEKYFLDLFEEERGTCDFVKKSQVPRQRARAIKFLVASRFVRISIFVALVGMLSAYIGFGVRDIVAEPSLSIEVPYDGYQTEKATIMVKGQAEENTKVKINGSEILLKSDGSFLSEISLERGLNMITIEGSKRYSKSAIEYRRVIFEQEKILGIN